MVLVAKAGLLPASEASSLLPLARSIMDSVSPTDEGAQAIEPLHTWLAPASAAVVRKLEAAIHRALISRENYVCLNCRPALEETSALASLFYVALFRTTRQLLSEFVPSNPTWVKKPATPAHRKRPGELTINEIFLSEIEQLSNRLIDGSGQPAELMPRITLGNAEKLTLADATVDVVVTSPPYCTRIDYAVATSIELAVLRTTPAAFDAIRRSLMGTSTVPRGTLTSHRAWGSACEEFLARVYAHSSKASQTYYHKSHVQYFSSLHTSVGELSRVLRPGGKAILVVQDSYYKELRNDIALITQEMAQTFGLTLQARKDFAASRSMASINNRARKYRATAVATESVLCFTKA
jgi:hypothetical protein